MKSTTQQPTGEEAIEQLHKLRDRFQNRGRGRTLTQAIIGRECKLRTVATVNYWLARPPKHVPTGPTLDSLCEFLERAKKPGYLDKITTQGRQ